MSFVEMQPGYIRQSSNARIYMATVKRTIHFFKLSPAVRSEVVPTREKLSACIQTIDQSTATHKYEISPGEHLCVWNDSGSEFKPYLKFCLGKIRVNNIPGTVIDGLRENLTANNVFDPTHIVVFKNGILAAEFTQAGPKAKFDLPKYFAHFFRSTINSFVVKDLYDEDILAVLDRFQSLTLLSMEVEKEKIGSLRAADAGLAENFKNLADPFPRSKLLLTLSLQQAEKLSKNKKERAEQREERHKIEAAFSHQVFEEVKKIISQGAEDGLDSLAVHGYDKRTKSVRTVDVLNSRISVKKNINLINAKTGMVDRDHMYEQMIEAYEELKESIENGHAL